MENAKRYPTGDGKIAVSGDLKVKLPPSTKV
jgi:hypothetical protein